MYADRVADHEEIPPDSVDESWRRLQIAEKLRGARFVVELKPPSDAAVCAVCGMNLARASTPLETTPGLTWPPRVFAALDGDAWVCNSCFAQYKSLVDWKLELPQIRQLVSPLTLDQLTPLHPRCRVVQFGNMVLFSDSEYRRLADFMSQYPGVPLRVYSEAVKDLDFLEYFPFLTKFEISSWSIESLDGLRFLSPALEALAIGNTKHKGFSLKVLERFPALKRLYLECQRKDFASVGTLSQLEDLTLRSITLPDLSDLTSLGRLESLDIKLGGTTDLRLLPRIGRLRYLEMWMIRGLADVSPVGELERLQHLFLESLKQVTRLPSFARMHALRRVTLQNLKGLRDLSPVRDAPALEELVVLAMPHLKPEALRPLAGHPTLRAALIALGSRKKDQEAKALLGLPKVQGKFEFRSKGS